DPLTVMLGAIVEYPFVGDVIPTAGAVLSMLIPETVAGLAALPALSTHAPVLVTDWPAPSPLRVAPAIVLVSRPDWTAPLSPQTKLAVTSVLFQPLAFARGRRLPVMTGLVLSMLMPVTVAELAALPAVSRQEPVFVTDWSAPSALTVDPA